MFEINEANTLTSVWSSLQWATPEEVPECATFIWVWQTSGERQPASPFLPGPPRKVLGDSHIYLLLFLPASPSHPPYLSATSLLLCRFAGWTTRAGARVKRHASCSFTIMIWWIRWYSCIKGTQSSPNTPHITKCNVFSWVLRKTALYALRTKEVFSQAAICLVSDTLHNPACLSDNHPKIAFIPLAALFLTNKYELHLLTLFTSVVLTVCHSTAYYVFLFYLHLFSEMSCV